MIYLPYSLINFYVPRASNQNRNMYPKAYLLETHFINMNITPCMFLSSQKNSEIQLIYIATYWLSEQHSKYQRSLNKYESLSLVTTVTLGLLNIGRPIIKLPIFHLAHLVREIKLYEQFKNTSAPTNVYQRTQK